MQNFMFHNPTRIVFGRGEIARLRELVPGGARVLVTYGQGSVLRNGVLDQVRCALADHARLFEFGGIEANPACETLDQAIALGREERVNWILAVGGGSVVDGSKYIAAGMAHPGEPWELLTTDAASRLTGVMPIGVVLTLPATGSESNDGAVISRYASSDKLEFKTPLVQPRFAILDPLTTFSLPPQQTANGIVDTFVHVTEQYLTYPAHAPIQDRWAEGLLQTLIETGPVLMEKPDDYHARATAMWGATLALNRLIGMGVPHDWSAHMIGHEVTGLFGIDHGRTLAALMPAVLEVCRDDKHDKLLQYAERVWGIRSGSEHERIDAAIAATRRFFRSLGVPVRLSEWGIGIDDLSPILYKLVAHGMTALGERRRITPEVANRILLAAL